MNIKIYIKWFRKIHIKNLHKNMHKNVNKNIHKNEHINCTSKMYINNAHIKCA